MDLIFDNFQILLVLGLALAAWLKNRSDTKAEEANERRVREEMARHFEKVDTKPVQKSKPEPWDTRPQAPPPIPQPPPLVEQPTRYDAPSAWDEPEEAHDAEPAPWESFKHVDTSHSEIIDVGEHHGEVILNRQRKMQERLAELKQRAKDTKTELGGARATQRRVAHKNQPENALIPMGSLRSTLKDKRQVKRAIVLNEILGKPLGLRGMS